MNQHKRPADSQEAAALVALLEISQCSPRLRGGRGDIFMILPYPGPFRLPDAVAILRQLPKPVLCAPIALFPGMAVWFDPKSIAMYKEPPLTKTDAEQLTIAGVKPTKTPSEFTILVQGRNDQVIISGADYLEWRRTYQMAGAGHARSLPNETDRRNGIDAILRFLQPELNDFVHGEGHG